jgi:hypothetical protein
MSQIETTMGIFVPENAHALPTREFFYREETRVLYEGEVMHEGRILHQYSLIVQPENIIDHPRVNRAEVALLQKYNTEIRVWTARYLDPSQITELRRNPRTISLGLFEGISTNHEQWTRESASLVHNAFQRIEATLLKYGEQDRDIFVYAVSCVGFGGSSLRYERQVRKEDVSVLQYIDYADILVRFMELEGIELGIAHSAAGEMLRMAPYFAKLRKMAGVAVSPALNVNGALQFSIYNMLSKLGRGVRENIWFTEGLVSHLEKLVVGYTTGREGPIEGFTQQVLMHQKENRKHPQVLAVKMNELGEEDMHIPKDLSPVGNIPITVTGESDNITYAQDIIEWHKHFLRAFQHQLYKRGLRIGHKDVEKAEEPSANHLLEKYFLRISPFGHDAALFNRNAQEFVLDALEDQLEKELKKTRHSTLNKAAERMGQVNNGTSYVQIDLEEDHEHGASAINKDGEQRYIHGQDKHYIWQLIQGRENSVLYQLDQLKTYFNWLRAFGVIKELGREVDFLKALGWPGGQVSIQADQIVEMYQCIVDSSAKSRYISQISFSGDSPLRIFKRAVLNIVNDVCRFPEVHLDSLFGDDEFTKSLRSALVTFALHTYESEGQIFISQAKLEEVLEIINRTKLNNVPVLDENAHPSVAVNLTLPAGISDVVALYELTK